MRAMRIGLLLVFLGCASVHSFGQADNDNFTNATPLTGTDGVFLVYPVGATLEFGEPTQFSGSLWYRWTAPEDGALELRPAWSPRCVYTGGTFSELKAVEGSKSDSSWAFRVRRGELYQIAVIEEPSVLVATNTFHFTPTLPNDSFTSRPILSTNTTASLVLNLTRETGEPPWPEDLKGGSCWWALPAVQTGSVALHVHSALAGGLFIFEGDRFEDLRLVISGSIYPDDNDMLGFNVEDGKHYSVAFLAKDSVLAGLIGISMSTSPLQVEFSAGPDVPAGRPAEVHFLNLPETPDPAAKLTLYIKGGPEFASLNTPFPERFAITNLDPGVWPFQLVLKSATGVVALAGTTINVRHPNDGFSERAQIQGTNGAQAIPVGATLEANEPPLRPGAFAASSWYKWQAPENGLFIIKFPGAELFSGSSLSELAEVTGATNVALARNETAFSVSAGAEYSLRLCRNPFDPFNTSFSYRFAPAPDLRNDDYINAREVAGEDVLFRSVPFAASLEPGEPSWNVYNASVWYRWTAPRTGVLLPQIAERFGPAWSSVALFRGNTLSTATALTNWTYGYRVEVFSGETLFIQHVGYANDADGANIRLLLHPASANDDFAAAEPMPGREGDFTADIFGATNEPFEAANNWEPAVWFKWTAPEDGFFRVLPSSLSISLLRGPSLTQLTNVASPDFYTRAFPVQSGNTYFVRAGYMFPPPPNSTWSYEFYSGIQPSNDAFDSATALDGVSVRLTVRTIGATSSPDDPVETFPDRGATKLVNTVWFDWVSPLTGWVSIGKTKTLDFPWQRDSSTIVVYTGDNPGSLTRIAGLAPNASTLGFHAEAGTCYRVLVAELPSGGLGPNAPGSFLDFSLEATSIRMAAPPGGAVIYDRRTLTCELSNLIPAQDGEVVTARYWIFQNDGPVSFVVTNNGAAPFSTTISNLYPAVYTIIPIITTRQPDRNVMLEPVSVSLRSTAAPHDFFLNRLLLVGPAVDHYFTAAELFAQTREDGEPPLPLFGGTLWFRWIAPFDGYLKIGSAALATNVAIFEGDVLTNLVRVPLSEPVRKERAYALQVAAYSTEAPLTLRLENLLHYPASDAHAVAGEPFLLDAASTADDETAKVWFFANDRLLASVSTPPPFTANAILTPGVYDLKSVHRLSDGVVFTNVIFAGFPVYATNITLANATIINPPQAIIDARGFHSGDAGVLNGPPLWFRVKPQTNVLITAQAGYFSVAKLTNVFATLKPLVREDTYYSDEPVYALEAGAEYLVNVFSPRFTNALIQFHIPPPNDNFENAATLSPDTTRFIPSLFFSSIQPGERNSIGDTLAGAFGSVWFKWTSPATGLVALDSGARLFSGAGIDSIHEVPLVSPGLPYWSEPCLPDCFRTYRVTSGVPYFIGVFDHWPPNQTNRLSIWSDDLLSNDNFADAKTLSGTDIVQYFLYPTNATYEPDEARILPGLPEPYPGFGSLWFRWMAPSNGTLFLRFDSQMSAHQFAVYQRTSPGLLRLPLSDYGMPEPIEQSATVQGGSEYFIAVERMRDPGLPVNPAVYQMALRMRLESYPENDSFTQRRALNGASVTLNLPPYHASREFREPFHAGEYGGGSVWYSWKVPASGRARLRAEWSAPWNWPTGGLVAVYQGTELSNLTSISALSSAQPTNSTTFHVTAGQEYILAVDNRGLPYPVAISLETEKDIPDPPSLILSAITDSLLEFYVTPPTIAPVTLLASSDLIHWTEAFEMNLSERATFTVPVPTNAYQFFRIRLTSP